MESKHWEKWRGGTRRTRHAARPWLERCYVLLATQSQTTYAEDRQSLVEDWNQLRKSRTEIMRSLWRSFYVGVGHHGAALPGSSQDRREGYISDGSKFRRPHELN